jgi:ATP-dependent Clp protease ATP-binding subunit ClpA
MNLDKFTQKAQEAVLEAQRLAGEYKHSQIEPEHLLAALVRQPEGVVPQVLARLTDVRALTEQVEAPWPISPRSTAPTPRSACRGRRPTRSTTPSARPRTCATSSSPPSTFCWR